MTLLRLAENIKVCQQIEDSIQKKLLFKLLNNMLTVNSSRNLIWLAHEKDQEVT